MNHVGDCDLAGYGFSYQKPDPSVGSGSFDFYNKFIDGIEFRLYRIETFIEGYNDPDPDTYENCFNIFWVNESERQRGYNPINRICSWVLYEDLEVENAPDKDYFDMFIRDITPLRRNRKLVAIGII